MTLFTEGRLQAFERMMQDTGKYHRREDSEDRPRKCPKKKAKPAKKDGEHHSPILFILLMMVSPVQDLIVQAFLP